MTAPLIGLPSPRAALPRGGYALVTVAGEELASWASGREHRSRARAALGDVRVRRAEWNGGRALRAVVPARQRRSTIEPLGWVLAVPPMPDLPKEWTAHITGTRQTGVVVTIRVGRGRPSAWTGYAGQSWYSGQGKRQQTYASLEAWVKAAGFEIVQLELAADSPHPTHLVVRRPQPPAPRGAK